MKIVKLYFVLIASFIVLSSCGVGAATVKEYNDNTRQGRQIVKSKDLIGKKRSDFIKVQIDSTQVRENSIPNNKSDVKSE